MEQKICESSGICPDCSGENLKYGMMYPEGESIYYEFTCEICGCTGKEYYDVDYSTTYYNPSNIEIDILQPKAEGQTDSFSIMVI